jgi:hypothetical protein
VTLSLNREETLSEQGSKTPSNNPDVDLQGNAAWMSDASLYSSFLRLFFPKKRRKEDGC